MQAVRLPPVARTREAFWPLYTAWSGAHRSALGCGDRPPPQPKRKVVEKWSLFQAFREKLHQANQEDATDLLKNFLGRGDFKKFHTSFHTDLACSQVPSCGRTLSFWAYLLTGQMENQRPRRRPMDTQWNPSCATLLQSQNGRNSST